MESCTWTTHLIMSTELLPRILKLPLLGSMLAVSPVLNHPSSVNSLLVASGLSKYSLKTLDPGTNSNPTLKMSFQGYLDKRPFTSKLPSTGVSFVWIRYPSWSDVANTSVDSGWRILQDTPGKGRPTCPGNRSDTGMSGLVSAMPISVMPYLSSNMCPLKSRNCSKTG